MEKVIIVAAGTSVKEGIEKGLWEKIKGNIIWSCNYAFMTMPYEPKRQLWVDRSFFKNNIIKLNELANRDVEMYAKDDNYLQGLTKIHCLQGSRNPLEYWGKLGKEKNRIFIGDQGFVGTFALHLAICENFTEIFLLGYDYGVPLHLIEQKKTHYYQDNLKVISSGMYRPEVYIEGGKIKDKVNDYNVFSQEPDVKIWNVSMESNINCFEKIDYDMFFKKLQEKL